MKLRRLYFPIPLMALWMALSCDTDPKTCTIRGTIHGVDYDTILLLKMGEDPRFDGIEIPGFAPIVV